MKDKIKNNFSVFVNSKSKACGARFWLLLKKKLESAPGYSDRQFSTVLCNADIPLFSLVVLKVRRKKIILRVDGLYHQLIDKTTVGYVGKYLFFYKMLLRIFGKKITSFIFNFIGLNYKIFIKVMFSNYIIYQSSFSKKMYCDYPFFRYKKSCTINNGSAVYSGSVFPGAINFGNKTSLSLVAVYDRWRCSKNIDKLLEFVGWVNSHKKIDLTLHMVGYVDECPSSFTEEHKKIMNSSFVIKHGCFGSVDEISNVYNQCDAFISFTYRDACPNVIIEAQAFFLPVIALSSGGVPEIAAIDELLIPISDVYGHFASTVFPVSQVSIDFERVFEALLLLASNQEQFRKRVSEYFSTALFIDKIAKDYLSVLCM